MNQTPIFDGTLSDLAVALQTEMKNNLRTAGKISSGDLYNSIRVQRTIGDDGIEVWMEEYGVFVDSGLTGLNVNPIYRNNIFNISSTRPSFPNLTALRTWVRRENIKFEKATSLDSMTYVIGQSIKRDGIRGTGFATRAFETVVEDYEDEIAEAYADDVVNFLKDL